MGSERWWVWPLVVQVEGALNATDPRGQDAEKMSNLRSINLNISARGLEALRSVDPSLGQ